MAILSPRVIRVTYKYIQSTNKKIEIAFPGPKRALFLLSYSVISAMENRVVWKIINHTHQDVDFVVDASEWKNKHIVLQSGLSPNIKTSAVAVFWVSLCIVLGTPSRNTTNESQLNSIEEWERNIASYNDLS